jgi:hypothetical protein
VEVTVSTVFAEEGEFGTKSFKLNASSRREKVWLNVRCWKSFRSCPANDSHGVSMAQAILTARESAGKRESNMGALDPQFN